MRNEMNKAQTRTAHGNNVFHSLNMGFQSIEEQKIRLSKQVSPFLNTKKKTLFDVTQIDLFARLCSAEQIEKRNPHRHTMALLDWIVWENAEKTRGVGLKEVREDEFWVKGHFPEKPILPGVLMIETAAQLACYLLNTHDSSCHTPLFLHIDQASFRSVVVPGDDLYILCQQVKSHRRRFAFEVQGWVNGHIAFESQITGSLI